MTREQAKAVIEKLVDRYKEQQKSYHAADYNETKTRRDFIDPFFKALGWDMDNEQDVAEPYREVIHEDKLKIQGKMKSPDYGFRLQGAKQRLYFVEAKKPSVALKTNKESAFQVRRYGWNSKVSVSILTNFEEFIVYDCSKKPNVTDSPVVGRLKTINYLQFLQEFDFIYDTFSREAVVKGRFDNYVKSDTAKKGTQTLDKEFVSSLDNWRQYLAIDIAKSNSKINEDELNFAVQLIIDRLIFLRFCEDRGVETYGQLKAATSKGNAYENLHGVFQAADDKYNSGLFDFEKDKITQDLKVTNKVIKSIVEDLYPPNSEYDFKAMPVEVLGNAYEQFLGKVIRINKAHHAVIEEKPEVRKAGGVYYTPQYIVDYIVENTVGKLIKGKTPKEIEKIKIVDPACGSGSFLLGAFDYLLNYHIKYYHKNPPTAKSGIITPNGTLSTDEKKRILLNNIFGVDLDANAVEVSKLSLLLKCMEGETAASISTQITMHNERVLPDLDYNIKDGNSLIDTDIYDTEIELGFEKNIKPFSWKKGFPEVFKQGGFDAVIGNPPYIKIQILREYNNEAVEYYNKKYKSSAKGNYDIYVLFIEQAFNLLNNKGISGYILPHKFFNAEYGEPIRKIVSELKAISEIVYFGDKQIFNGATTYTCLLFLDKNKKTDFDFINVTDLEKWKKKELKGGKINYSGVNESNWNFNISSTKPIFDKVAKKGSPLGSISKIFVGLQTSADPIYILKLLSEDKKHFRVFSKELGIEFDIEKQICKPLLKGSEIKRFRPPLPDNIILFPYFLVNEEIRLMDEKTLNEKYPKALEYLKKNKSRLLKRSDVDPRTWWHYPYPKNLKEMMKPKILTQVLAKKASFTLDLQATFCFVGGGNAGGYGLIINSNIELSTSYLIGLLNSKILDSYLQNISTPFRGGFFSYAKRFIENIPIILPHTTSEKNIYSSISKNVESLLRLHEELLDAKVPTKIEQLNDRIDHIKEKIDQLVYELYELTPEEIKIMEESVSQ